MDRREGDRGRLSSVHQQLRRKGIVMRVKPIFVILILTFVIACGLFGEAGTPTSSETQAPAADTPGAPESGKGQCGDSVCDQAEQDNPNLCPQDCTEASAPVAGATPAPGAKSGPDYEPPINIFMILHIDPIMDKQKNFVLVSPEIYQQTRQEIYWLKEEAERHGLRFTALYNGWYPQEALELADVDQFRELLATGHEIGTHAHRLTYDPAQDLWISRREELSKIPPITYDPELARQTWADAYQYVDAVLKEIDATGQNQIVCAVAHKASDEGRLMEQFGFTIAAGQRGESSIQDFGHIVWNPWRISASDEPGRHLEEDLNTRFITIPHLAQIGIRGGVHAMDLSQAQIRRRFLMLYTEWLSRERRGAEDKVWSFGFVYHPEDGDVFNQELADFLAWLDENFIGKTSPHGNIIARYATVGEIGKQFVAWEGERPGASSFSYVRGDPYPYTYPLLPDKLGDAAYEGRVNLGEGVTALRFSKGGQPIYLVWSDIGERRVDFSAEISGQVKATTAAGGESTLEASELPLSEEPLFVEPIN